MKIEVQLAGPADTERLNVLAEGSLSDPCPPQLPCVEIGRFATGTSPGGTIALGYLKIGGDAAAAAA